MLSVISKILERCVYNRTTNIIEHLKTNSLLLSQQFGFRKKRSTEFANVLFMDNIRRAMDKGEMKGALFVDLSKAFDTVSHSSILDKLPYYGINQQELSWFTDYLFNRTIQVSYNGTLSNILPMYCGVPQGSILGPLLFYYTLIEALDLMQHCEILLYADDTVLYYHHSDLNVIEKALSEDLATMSSWLEENEMILNLKKGKTEIMLFGTMARLNRQQISIEVSYRSQTINVAKSYKYLGVMLDQSLNLSNHFSTVCKKISTRLRLLQKIRPFITKLAALRIYQSLIIPIAMYCSLVNFENEPSRKTSLATLENRARRIIDQHDIPSINNICKKKVCRTVHQCLNNQYPFFTDYFQCLSHNQGTRNNSKILRVPKIRLQSTKKSFFLLRNNHI